MLFSPLPSPLLPIASLLLFLPRAVKSSQPEHGYPGDRNLSWGNRSRTRDGDLRRFVRRVASGVLVVLVASGVLLGLLAAAARRGNILGSSAIRAFRRPLLQRPPARLARVFAGDVRVGARQATCRPIWGRNVIYMPAGFEPYLEPFLDVLPRC